MCTSYKLLSHKNLKEKNDQKLVEHLKGVSNIMVNLAKAKGIKDEEFLEVLRIIGMCHDFGKGSKYFQDYLKGTYNGELKNHGEISAYLCYYLLPERWKLYGFIAVKRHHGNIELDLSFFHPSDKEKLEKMVLSLKDSIEELEAIYNVSLEDFFSKVLDGSLYLEIKKAGRRRTLSFKGKSDKYIIEEFVYFQYIWSLLLTADKSQLIRGEEYRTKEILGEELCEKYKNNIREYLKKNKKGIEKTKLFNIREEIYKEAIEGINNRDIKKEKMFSINVPTGTGKTITVYGTALKLKEKVKKEIGINLDIIYSLPFTSIIDQNYEVLKEIMQLGDFKLNSEYIIKYNSLCEIEYKADKNEYEDIDEKFLLENWQSTIITTTFIQIFNAIFKSGINSVIHRFHKLVGSIIILDEIQAINPKYQKIIEEVLKILCDKFNCYVITVTATKPLFLLGKELIKDNKRIFKEMDRIEFHNYTEKETSLEEFKNIIRDDIVNNKDKSFLFIMNTINSSKEIKSFIDSINDSRKVYYLSTELLPIHRLEIINKIKESKEKTILVSTQLIEAGVDIDYDIVYRDLAPLDSINQGAGRANRNSIGSKGIVKLYNLVDESGRHYRNIYSNILIETTLNILKGKRVIKEEDIYELNESYFKQVAKSSENLKNEVYCDFLKYMKEFDFESIREKFELIEKNNFKLDVIVPYDENALADINIIKNNSGYLEVINAWIRLNRYKISVNKSLIKNVYYEDLGVKFLDKCHYDKNIGVVPKNITSI